MNQKVAGAQASGKRPVEFPSAYTILFALIAIFAALTWVVPAGQYNRVQDPEIGREVTVRGSYHSIDAHPQTPLDIIMAPIGGFYDAKSGKTRAADIVLFVLFVGGFMGMVNRTGAIDVAMTTAMTALKGREHLLIPVLMGLFALGGTVYGMEEEAIPILALLVPVMMRAGYDSIVAAAIVIVGTSVGRFGGLINPFATGIASSVAGVSLTDGIALRAVLLVIGWTISSAWVMRYAARVRKTPELSLIADRRREIEAHFETSHVPEARLSARQIFVLAIFILTFAVLIWGVASQGWWMAEMSALFLGSSLLMAVAAGTGEREFVDAFVSGARELLGVALIVALARGVLVVMDNGHITDTILHGGEVLLNGLPSIIFINGIQAVDVLMSFVVPSSSGLSVLATPVFAPLADFADVPRALIVTANQTGINITQLLTPTSAGLMGMLAIARVPYDRWLRFVAPLALILFALGAAALSIGLTLG
ncbi:MAG: YfcC family protein [Alphaproteobacteria bacterium]|nr:YfcC family protein [Alphaproteobacteria bacterium]